MKEKEAQDILDFYLQCYSFDEIGIKLGISKDTVHRAFDKRKLSQIEQPESLQFYNVWSIGKLGSDQLKYPGQTLRNAFLINSSAKSGAFLLFTFFLS